MASASTSSSDGDATDTPNQFDVFKATIRGKFNRLHLKLTEKEQELLDDVSSLQQEYEDKRREINSAIQQIENCKLQIHYLLKSNLIEKERNEQLMGLDERIKQLNHKKNNINLNLTIVDFELIGDIQGIEEIINDIYMNTNICDPSQSLIQHTTLEIENFYSLKFSCSQKIPNPVDIPLYPQGFQEQGQIPNPANIDINPHMHRSGQNIPNLPMVGMYQQMNRQFNSQTISSPVGSDQTSQHKFTNPADNTPDYGMGGHHGQYNPSHPNFDPRNIQHFNRNVNENQSPRFPSSKKPIKEQVYSKVEKNNRKQDNFSENAFNSNRIEKSRSIENVLDSIPSNTVTHFEDRAIYDTRQHELYNLGNQYNVKHNHHRVISALEPSDHEYNQSPNRPPLPPTRQQSRETNRLQTANSDGLSSRNTNLPTRMSETGNMVGDVERIVDKGDDRAINDANSVPKQFGNVYGIKDHTSFQSNTNINVGNSGLFDYTVDPTPQEREKYLQMWRNNEAQLSERERPISNRPDLNQSISYPDQAISQSGLSEMNRYNPYAQNMPMQSELDIKCTSPCPPLPPRKEQHRETNTPQANSQIRISNGSQFSEQGQTIPTRNLHKHKQSQQNSNKRHSDIPKQLNHMDLNPNKPQIIYQQISELNDLSDMNRFSESQKLDRSGKIENQQWLNYSLTLPSKSKSKSKFPWGNT